MTMFGLIILLPIVLGLEYVLTALDNSGFAMERIPKVLYTKQAVEIATYVNLTEIKIDLSILDKIINVSGEACLKLKVLKLQTHCEFEMASIRHRQEEMMGFEFLFKEKERNKRSVPLLGILGKVAKTLIGTEENFKRVKKNEDMLVSTVQKQTMVLNSLFEIINKTTIPSIEMFDKFQEKFKDFSTYVTNYHHNTDNQILRMYSELGFRECISLTNLLCTTIQGKINQITNLLVSERENLHPFLIPSDVLIEKLMKVSAVLPKGSRFPLRLDSSNIFEYYRMSTESRYRFKEFLIFVAHIPTVHDTIFHTFKLTAIPVRLIDNKFTVFKFEKEILVTDNEMKKYTSLPSRTLDFCEHLNDIILCPHLFSMNSKPSCELSLLKQSGESEKLCKKTVLQLEGSLFIKLYMLNTWVIVAPSLEISHLICKDKNQPMKLANTAMITINADCKLITDHVYLTPEITVRSNVDVMHQWMLNFTEIDFNFTRVLNSSDFKIPVVKSTVIHSYENNKLANIGKHIQQLEDEKIILEKIESRNTEYQIIKIGFGVILLGMISYIFVKIYFMCCKVTKKTKKT
ncbi:uncharacterized protein LOC129762942 isoform X1 [Toxorhynchites rutilus septentrionalis]|uniref:uncharacterized protein LOC129762942 isoform X1 n=1 Tax=Toxorhynchites rutilus septentrionalis TaxID=329112 RepID=UPI00247AA5DA|nr:uncharacterized protein LOC129762942 isoform X1 [Toxorhynchites rutilus septentrionalis]XP_055617550.1 uncharacterized protein LOC129762942 isoform X1 [Toxorhynchites rutilus septentrionalis]